tara:strand:- start:13365 stop:14387 length:1023 start_codon:yes stop_codon:yes gene_type:complete
MKLIFCISNLFIPATLTLIKEAGDKHVLVYTDQKGILEFFESIHLKNVTIYYRQEIYLRKSLKSIVGYFKVRNKILKELQSYSFSELYFFHNIFGMIENWLMKALSSKMKIYQIPIFNELQFDKKYTIKSLKGVLRALVIDKVKVEPLWNGHRFIYRASDSFFKSIKAKIIKLSIDDAFIKEIIQDTFRFGDSKMVLLTGSVIELKQVSEDEYIKKINVLIEKIGRKHISAKPHPRLNNRYGFENDLNLIPSFIPANVLFSKFKIFIGYSSSVLSEVADNGGIAISLLDYFKPVSNQYRNTYKNYLNDNLEKGIIHYPTNIDSVISILRNNSELILDNNL